MCGLTPLIIYIATHRPNQGEAQKEPDQLKIEVTSPKCFERCTAYRVSPLTCTRMGFSIFALKYFMKRRENERVRRDPENLYLADMMSTMFLGPFREIYEKRVARTINGQNPKLGRLGES